MGFNASSVEPLAYDFTACRAAVEAAWPKRDTRPLLEGDPEPTPPPPLPELVGVIPEPSVAQLEAFNEFWLNQVGPAFRAEVESVRQLMEENDPAKADDLLQRTQDLRVQVSVGTLLPPQMDALAALCSGQPPAALLHVLPARVQQGFRDYIMAELVDAPKGKNGSAG